MFILVGGGMGCKGQSGKGREGGGGCKGPKTLGRVGWDGIEFVLQFEKV